MSVEAKRPEWVQRRNQFRYLWREEARVEFHLNEGYTKVSCCSLGSPPDIPTDLIPHDLRRLGSSFLLTVYLPHWEQCQTIHEVKEALIDSIHIERVESI
jgi:hypothetical protein